MQPFRRLLPPRRTAPRVGVLARAAALLYAVLALPLAVIGALAVLTALLLGGALSWTALGTWVIAAGVRVALALGDVQRALTGGLLGVRIEAAGRRGRPSGGRGRGEGPQEARDEGGAFAWRRSLLGGRAGWRAVGCALLAPVTCLLPPVAVVIGYVHGTLLVFMPVIRRWDYITVRSGDGSVRHVGLMVEGVVFDDWPLAAVPTVVGVLLLLSARWLVANALVPHRLLLASLLGPDRADLRIRTLEETRALAVDDAAATLRRIERDLHDGTQARLVGLGMHLTMIRELVTGGADSEQVLRVVETAQGNAKQAVADLRHLVKGIHPPVLDQGLETALATLAADCGVPVELDTGLEGRPTPAIESIAYFCAAEALANTVKHSGATAVSIRMFGAAGALLMSVEDNGRGGAEVGAGSGLSGLLARVRTVDGTLRCDSPVGGPTVVTVLLPYR
ncbi:sensor histidine kinase [Streptomyces sp. NBC_01497]|uniref:sensor histidine kinase n=1 Tax=Streptomyces sp. NBC_01497 TaxID=2903885 RepID=UPI002E31AAD6|nr:sensor domain-containing protein [Streptomyces sp. NBC_01497]